MVETVAVAEAAFEEVAALPAVMDISLEGKAETVLRVAADSTGAEMVASWAVVYWVGFAVDDSETVEAAMVVEEKAEQVVL